MPQQLDFRKLILEMEGWSSGADDIASLSVLKGPGAAALYGTRASNE